MNSPSLATIRRAAAVILAAAVLSICDHRASAQTFDLFEGIVGTPAGLSVSSTLNIGTISNFGAFGVDGYSGSVSLNGGAINTLSEGFVTDTTTNTNVYYISQTGVAALGGTTTATKTFGGTLAPSTTYLITMNRASGATVGLLGSFGIALSNNGTVFLDTSNGVGLLGAVDLLGLFGTNNVSTLTFTTPANYNPTGTLGVTFTSNLPVGALGGAYVFTGASITAVPEPTTISAMILGAGALFALRSRRLARLA